MQTDSFGSKVHVYMDGEVLMQTIQMLETIETKVDKTFCQR